MAGNKGIRNKCFLNKSWEIVKLQAANCVISRKKHLRLQQGLDLREGLQGSVIEGLTQHLLVSLRQLCYQLAAILLSVDKGCIPISTLNLINLTLNNLHLGSVKHYFGGLEK